MTMKISCLLPRGEVPELNLKRADWIGQELLVGVCVCFINILKTKINDLWIIQLLFVSSCSVF